MKTTIGLVWLCLWTAWAAAAQQAGFQDSLLDHLTGEWVMEGTIAGSETTHDIVAEWVLGHYYLRFHEVSRELTDAGEPEYEAIVIIGWDQPSERYVCLWLDSTGGSGLASQVLGYAKRVGDELAFVFDTGDDGIIHNTIAYNRKSDAWQMRIDNERGGERRPFARVTLRRRVH